MPTIKTTDGTQIYYKDWGRGQTIVFSHGWPLNADAWEDQMMFLARSGFRCIAHDRRGHGRSDQPSSGNDMDTYADDLADLIDELDLDDVIHVGHSTGGGEVARYIGRHGTSRVAKAVLVSAVPPLVVRTADNPDGTPIEALDQLRNAILADRSTCFREFAKPFFGANRPDSKVPQSVLDWFWVQCMQCGFIGEYECVRAFSETDFTEDLKQFDIPTLIIHGEEDQIVPIKAAALRSAKIVPGAILRVYPGAPHGLPATHKEQLGLDLLSFAQVSKVAATPQAEAQPSAP